MTDAMLRGPPDSWGCAVATAGSVLSLEPGCCGLGPGGDGGGRRWADEVSPPGSRFGKMAPDRLYVGMRLQLERDGQAGWNCSLKV